MTRDTAADTVDTATGESADTATDASNDTATGEPTGTPTDAPNSNATFEAVISAEPLQTALDAAVVLVDECIVQADPDAFRVVATDPATVGIVAATLDPDAFERYETAGVRLGVDLSRLTAVVGMAGENDRVRLSLDPESRKLTVRVGDLEYTLALVDPEAIRALPDVVDFSEHFVAAVELDGGTFARGVDAAAMVSNHVEIGVEGDDEDGGDGDGGDENGGDEGAERAGSDGADAAGRSVFLRADGDTDSVDFGVDAADCAAFEVDPDAEPRSLFSLSYLEEMNRVVPSGRPVRLRVGERETPMDLTFDVADGDGRVTFALAPRISRN